MCIAGAPASASRRGRQQNAPLTTTATTSPRLAAPARCAVPPLFAAVRALPSASVHAAAVRLPGLPISLATRKGRRSASVCAPRRVRAGGVAVCFDGRRGHGAAAAASAALSAAQQGSSSGSRPAGSGACRRCGAALLLHCRCFVALAARCSAAQQPPPRRHGTRRQNAAAARYCTRAFCGTPAPSLLPLTPRTRPSRTCRASLGDMELSVVKIAEAWRARSRSS